MMVERALLPSPNKFHRHQSNHSPPGLCLKQRPGGLFFANGFLNFYYACCMRVNLAHEGFSEAFNKHDHSSMTLSTCGLFSSNDVLMPGGMGQPDLRA